MIDTQKIINTYTDVFNNEIDKYEQMERYTVSYEGRLFDGDTNGYNKHNCGKKLYNYIIHTAI